MGIVQGRFPKPVFMAAVLLAAASVPAAETPRLAGAWILASVRIESASDTVVISPPRGGLFLFLGRHYSMSWIPSAGSRRPSVRRWFPTASEKSGDFDTVVFNAGTYTADDSILTVHPSVSKTPEFTGGSATYRIRAAGDTLWVEATRILSFDGVPDPGPTAVRPLLTLLRAE
jgi:hypothetical protein